MNLPTPYYEHAGITIYNCDCRDILPLLKADVVITDPPYGVELGASDSRGSGHGLAKQGYLTYSDTPENWFALVPGVVTTALRKCKRGAVFPGKHAVALPEPDCIGGVYCPSGVGRNPWGFTNLMPVFFYGVEPRLQFGARQTVLRSVETAERNGHPCPKPLGWMYWLVDLVSLPGETLLDPFMGSGTTLVAAKQLGRRGIGIEIEERYVEIAVKRLAQEVLPLEPQQPEPEQTGLLP